MKCFTGLLTFYGREKLRAWGVRALTCQPITVAADEEALATPLEMTVMAEESSTEFSHLLVTSPVNQMPGVFHHPGNTATYGLMYFR